MWLTLRRLSRPDLSGLSERERFIVQARGAGKTLREIGKGLGLSAERVRQIEALARPRMKGVAAALCIADLTKRGDPRVVIRRPEQSARSGAAFCDRAPPKHVCSEPKPSREIVHHRANAPRLADLRGNAPLEIAGPRTRHPCMGALMRIQSWRDVDRLTDELGWLAAWRDVLEWKINSPHRHFEPAHLEAELKSYRRECAALR